MKKIALYILTILVFCNSVFAVVDSGEAPIWFNMLEPIGVGIGVITLVFSYMNLKKFGGTLGKSYLFLMGSIIFFILAFSIRSLVEFEIISENFITELGFEFMLYLGVIFIAVCSYISSKGFDDNIKKAK